MKQLEAVAFTGMPRANVEFEVVMIKGKVFVILYDKNTIGSRSITNDVDAVVVDLLHVVKGACSGIIFYRDTEGCYEQIVCDNDTVGFKSLNAALSFEEALCEWEIRENKR